MSLEYTLKGGKVGGREDQIAGRGRNLRDPPPISYEKLLHVIAGAAQELMLLQASLSVCPSSLSYSEQSLYDSPVSQHRLAAK